MFDITLIVMGKLKEKFYLTAAAEYEKRLKGYCSFKIVGIVEANETAFYLTERALAKSVLPNFVALGSDYGVSLDEGQVALYIPFGINPSDNHYKVDDEITIHGKKLTVSALLTPNDLNTDGMPRVEVYDDFILG